MAQLTRTHYHSKIKSPSPNTCWTRPGRVYSITPAAAFPQRVIIQVFVHIQFYRHCNRPSKLRRSIYLTTEAPQQDDIIINPLASPT